MIVPLLTWLGVFIVSLVVLIKASDYFVSSSSVIGKAMRLPAFIIGVTLVAIGTSLPELASSIFAVFKGNSEIVIGNVIGSNIANIFLVLGITVVFAKKIEVLREIIHIDLPLLVGSAFFLAITIWDGVFSFFETILLLLGLILYLVYTASTQEKDDKVTRVERKIKRELRKREFDMSALLVFFVSAFFIFLGAKYTIDAVVNLSEILSIGTEIIAVSAIALGTSLPELVVSLSAVKTGKSEIAVGNILGSSIFNVFGVLGIAGLFGSIVVPDIMLSLGLPMMLIATVMFFFTAQDRRISQWEGGLLILFYVFFVAKLFGLV